MNHIKHLPPLGKDSIFKLKPFCLESARTPIKAVYLSLMNCPLLEIRKIPVSARKLRRKVILRSWFTKADFLILNLSHLAIIEKIGNAQEMQIRRVVPFKRQCGRDGNFSAE